MALQNQIPFLSLKKLNQPYEQQFQKAYQEVIDSGWYILGKKGEAFEEAFAKYNKVNYCLGVSNGLDALHIALKTLGIGSDDEVIIPSNTYIATALAVSYVGATPIFVEPNKETYNIDPENIKTAITNKTKAIMPVHLYGQCCEMDAIMDIAEKHNLFVIEDNAQSQGSVFNNKLAGSFGHINGTSFYPGKNLGALGDGGAITTNDSILYNRAKMMRNYGSDKKYHNEIVGYNMRLDEMQAAFLSIKLQDLENSNAKRNQVARWYNEFLSNCNDIILPVTAHGATHVYHLYVVRVKKREAFQQYLQENNIGTLIHYPIPPHLQKAYEHLGFKKGAFPIAEELADTCVSLPMAPYLTKEEVAYIATVAKQFFTK